MEFVSGDRFFLLWILVALIGAGIFSYLLYRRDFFSKEYTTRSWKYILLLSLRGLSVFLVLLLLTGLIFKVSVKKTENPIVIFALDNSKSLIYQKDSGFVRNTFYKDWDDLQKNAGKHFETRNYLFGERVREMQNTTPLFADQQTDISALFSELSDRFENRNIGAIVLASDGIYNNGEYPVYTAGQLKVPVYTIALGDAMRYRDVYFRNVKYNKIVFSGNAFQAEAEISTSLAKGKQVKINTMKDGQVIESRMISIQRDNEVITQYFTFQTDKPGIQKFTLIAEPIEGEKNLGNNRYDLYVEALENKSKMLLLAASPHPDISALKQAIEGNERNTVDVYYAYQMPAPTIVKDYQAVIYHGLPSLSANVNTFMDKCYESQVSQLFVISGQTAINLFNGLNTGLRIENSRYGFNDATPIFNNAFGLFNLDQETIEAVNDFPPLSCPFGNYIAASANGQNVFEQRIGSVSTHNPLIYVNNSLEGRVAIICGEGIYKWRIYDYMKQESHHASDQLIQSVMQFLSAKKDTRKFRVYTEKNIYRTVDNIFFNAEVYNENNEAVTNAKVTMQVKDSSGKTRQLTFSPVGERYELNMGAFEGGEYSYYAEATYANKTEKTSGRFTIQDMDLEQLNLTANYELMKEISQKSGGKFYTANDFGKLLEELEKNKKLSSTSYLESSYKNLVDMKWLFFLLLILLSAEWSLRKFLGTI